jgi:lysophospholipase L1-like esterase
MKKILIINLSIFTVFMFFIEIIMGYWFKENSFGIYIRSDRNRNEFYTSRIHEDEYKYYYKRNFYGFRGNDFNPKDVEIVFQGGSTGNERFLPEEMTIVSLLNKKFKEDNITKIIYNASADGKTTNSYANDFIYWFPKIKDFKPKYFIFYTGINDSFLETHPQHYDLKVGEKWNTKVEDYIKNNSFFYEIIKKIQNKYFAKKKLAYSLNYKNLYNNYKFVDYLDANTIHNNINETEKEFLKKFINRLENLKIQINKNNVVPIFITQVRYDGLGDKKLFLINEEIKKFCLLNDFYIIKLDEKIKLEEKDFFDETHTAFKGNLKISKILYNDLKKILTNF